MPRRHPSSRSRNPSSTPRTAVCVLRANRSSRPDLAGHRGSRRSASGRLGHLLEHQASGQFAPIPAIHGPRWNRELRPQSVRRLTADRLGSRRNPHTRSQIRCGPRNVAKKGNVVPRLACGTSRALTGPAAARPSCDADDFLNVLNDAADQELSCYPLQRQYQKGGGLSGGGRALSGNAPTRDARLACSCPAAVVGIERGLDH